MSYLEINSMHSLFVKKEREREEEKTKHKGTKNVASNSR